MTTDFIVEQEEDNLHAVAVTRIGEMLYISTNERCLGMDDQMAMELVKCISAVLTRDHDRALTATALRLEKEAERRPDFSPRRDYTDMATSKRNIIPNLEDI